MKLLIVEDDRAFAETLKLEFEELGAEVRLAECPETVAAVLSSWQADTAVIDLRLQGHDGLAVLTQVLEACPGCRAVVLTGYGSVATAVEAMKRGAFDYLTKPVSMAQLVATLEKDLPETPAVPRDWEPERESLARHEHEYIAYVLTRCDGNISKAARWLGIHRQSLQRKLRKYPPRV